MSLPPANWIPPEFREFVTVPLTSEEAAAILGTCGHFDTSGVRHDDTVEEIQEQFPRITGVRDTRTGEVHPQLSKDTKFLQV